MGYILALVDKRLNYSFKVFQKKYSCLDGCNDYHRCSPRLQSLFLELKDIVRPLNGEYLVADDDVDTGKCLDSEYVFGKDVIWIECASSDVQNVLGEVIAIAQKHKVVLYDIDGGRAILPNGMVINKKTDRTREWIVALGIAIALIVSMLFRK